MLHQYNKNIAIKTSIWIMFNDIGKCSWPTVSQCKNVYVILT